jgi:predicted RNA binding protein YcfA (HicA-like mRNA interferase family)
VTSREAVSILKRLGFEEIRQKGSRLTLRHSKTGAACTIPIHSGETLAPKTLQSILKQAGVDVDKFAKEI